MHVLPHEKHAASPLKLVNAEIIGDCSEDHTGKINKCRDFNVKVFGTYSYHYDLKY
jgi:hypothetical protein